jgi:hypothetical protein
MSEQLANAVAGTLDEVHERDGAEVAYRLAAANIASSVKFLLERIGPQASRRALGAVTARLEQEIARNNGGTGWVQ